MVTPLQPLLGEGETAYVAISGLTNGYSSYVTTLEEYQGQRYEAASTIYGPHTLSGYIQELTRIAKDMVKGVYKYTHVYICVYDSLSLSYIYITHILFIHYSYT